MCIQCHTAFTDEQVTAQLLDAIGHPEQFDDYNTTSISHITLSALGVNGEEAQICARKLLKMYLVHVQKDTAPVRMITLKKMGLQINSGSPAVIFDFDPDPVLFKAYCDQVCVFDRNTSFRFFKL